MTTRVEAALPESARIAFLLQRDGHAATRAWVERTARIYETAIADPHGHARDSFYRPLFERAIGEFHDWLRADAASASANPSASPPSTGT